MNNTNNTKKIIEVDNKAHNDLSQDRYFMVVEDNVKKKQKAKDLATLRFESWYRSEEYRKLQEKHKNRREEGEYEES